jgi:hypothetical protein
LGIAVARRENVSQNGHRRETLPRRRCGKR